MPQIILQKYNDVYLRVICEPDIAYELRDKFTFKVPGYFYMPKYRAGIWDGSIKLFNVTTGRIYAGLIEQIREFAKVNNYEAIIDPNYSAEEFSVVEAQEFIKTIKIPEKFTLREEQIKPFIYGVRNRRLLLLSPTGSGKSLIIYYFIRWLLNKSNILLIVPTTTLIHQMFNDFVEYGFNSERYCQKIYEGQSKDITKLVTISTWQSIYKFPEKWFNQFNAVIGDEAHGYKAASLISIMEKLTNCPFRIGTTGTIDDSLTHQMVLEGLFGPIRSYTTTKKLMDSGTLSTLNIKAIVLQYSKEIRQALKKTDYRTEINFIIGNEPRNKFIRNLALSLDGNTLLLFQYVDKHGKILYNMLKDSGRKVYYIHGGIEGEERNKIREIVLKEKNSIIVASYGTYSQGINIPNLNNVIAANPFKARIRVLQSIGRGIRKTDEKDTAVWYDIADDLSIDDYENYTLDHFRERLKMYGKEEFQYKIYYVKIGDK